MVARCKTIPFLAMNARCDVTYFWFMLKWSVRPRVTEGFLLIRRPIKWRHLKISALEKFVSTSFTAKFYVHKLDAQRINNGLRALGNQLVL